MKGVPIVASRTALLVAASAVLVTGEWLRTPMRWSAVAVVVACTIAAAVAWRAGRTVHRLIAAQLLVLALVAAVTAVRQDRVERDWGRERLARIDAAFDPVSRALADAKALATRIADAGLRAADRAPDEAFLALDAALEPKDIEQGVVLFGARGVPVAWAGAQRLLPSMLGPELGIRQTPFVFVLEVRRRDARGRTAIASVLLSARSAVVGGERSLAAMFAARHGIGLTFYVPGLAPASAAVFEWTEPTDDGPRTLLSARPIPPEQSEARQRIVGAGGGVAAVLLLGVMATVLSLVRRAAARGALLLLLVWLPLRAPIGRLLGLESLFAPTTFFASWGGPFAASAGALLLSGVALVVGGLWVQQRQWPSSAARRLAAGAAAFAVPWFVLRLAAGITLPAEGADLRLWLVWEVALAAVGLGALMLLSALARPNESEGRRLRLSGVLLALAVAAAVPFVWDATAGVPTALAWLAGVGAALALGERRSLAAVLVLTTVAGSWAGAAVWNEELHDRLSAVQRDVAALDDQSDALAYAQLETFADNLLAEPSPASRADLFALWRVSSLRQQQRYPAQLALWRPDGTLRQQLALDSLDVPTPLLASYVRRLQPGEPRAVGTLLRANGPHHLHLTRLASGDVLTTLIGPRSRLIAPTRIGSLLDPAARAAPDYDLALVPAARGQRGTLDSLRWSRERWRVSARAALPLGERPADVLARVDLRGPAPLALRGIAMLAFNLLLAVGLLFVMQRVAGQPMALQAWRTAARGFRARLGLALAVFVLVPIIATALWSFSRLDDEGARARDLVLGVLLRDASDERAVDERLRGEAEPARYEGALLDTATAPLFHQLGLLDALVPPAAFQGLVLRGQPEATVLKGAAAIGFREAAVGRGSGEVVVAVPMPLADAVLARSQLDLVLGVLVAALAGAIAALTGAALASRFLARPVAELRRAALAIGRGSDVPLREGPTPTEFEPVFGAFERMVEDLRAGRAALETAQSRLAATLATVATGVVALDDDGVVLVANPRAEALLGLPVPTGQPFGLGLPPVWAELLRLIAQARKRQDRLPDPRELAIDDRRVLLTVTRLGAGVPGLVLALNDVTELSRAERVLAWGEMAQQVAHEIKNPLTPMRLGVQHLQRAFRDRRETFDVTLDETSRRILEEIDRLDGVARAFSRFAAPAPTPGPLAPIDVAAVARDVVQLYRLAGEGAAVRVEADGPVLAPARTDELKEVLVNLLENARAAGARQVLVRVNTGSLRVEDDGHGIAAAHLARIFEPRFSTNTSGSGLGLAIVKRLVEGWNATVAVSSEEGQGTVLELRFAES